MLVPGTRRRILEFFADTDWHGVEEVADLVGMTRNDTRRTLNDIAADGYLSKSDLEFAITDKGQKALKRPAALTLGGAAAREIKERRERGLLATLATRDGWWSTPEIIKQGGAGFNREVVLKSCRGFLARGYLEYQPSPVFVKSPEYRVTVEGRSFLAQHEQEAVA